MDKQGNRYEQLKDRRGRFMVSRLIFTDELEGVEKLLQRVIPFAIENDHFNYDGITYTAMSEEFDKVAKGEMAPWYDCEFEKLGDEVIIRFVRRT